MASSIRLSARRGTSAANTRCFGRLYRAMRLATNAEISSADGAAPAWRTEVLGADLAYVGARFVASAESGASDDYRAMINSGADDQV